MNNQNELNALIEKKITFFHDIIQKTVLHVQNNKMLDIISISDSNASIDTLFEINEKIKTIHDKLSNNKLSHDKTNTDSIISLLQSVNNDLSSLFKNFGTYLFEDLLWVCFGNNYANTYTSSDIDIFKFELLKKYFHPTNYRILNSKKDSECKLNETSRNLDCIYTNKKHKNFHFKTFGLQIIVHNPKHKNSIIVTGIVDNIIIDLLNDKYIQFKIDEYKKNIANSSEFKCEMFSRFLQTLNLKDYLIYDSHNIYTKYAGCLSNLKQINEKTTQNVIKDFISSNLYVKRNTIIHLLVNADKYDNQYLAYLLYDLISNDNKGNIDTQEQITLIDSLPWFIKQMFKNAMKNTIQYTNNLTNFDSQKIPLEQQICLLKVSDSVKEKAMQKLKEIKSKTDDSGSKARQYLDGLLKIPFNIYRKEPILQVMNDIKTEYNQLLTSLNKPLHNNCTNLEILSFLKLLKKELNHDIDYNKIVQNIQSMSVSELKNLTNKINEYLQTNGLELNHALKLSNAPKKQKAQLITDFLLDNKECLSYLFPQDVSNSNLLVSTTEIESKYKEINSYMNGVKNILDNSVHGHEKAKKQIEMIIGQWINGTQDGYCFGFEGPAGVGKTTLAKRGLANCLTDENGVSRPFSMIQIGGDSDGSSLRGHNYTYVGSTWGSIVQILIDKKCMNPIIFIDEIDKISKTEHGKEIIGILTHMLDPAQNDCFQDKYFSGIDLDLSKALFILSYNDVEAIDKIMLDRIHRIKFNGLTLDEKIVISNKHLLPEIFEKMGLQNMLYFSDEVIKYIINEYTLESGVRKLKEVLFEIIGEINLSILKNMDLEYEIPINITIDDIKNKYFKDKHEIRHKKIHDENAVGLINGLWANAHGQSGIIPIQTSWRPSNKFLNLYLTGMQGDVMKESMNVALTLAWNLTDSECQNKMLEEQSKDVKNGIHIHCPEGATPKDGPSAGAAITTTIYSLFNNRKIKRNVAITGEVSLDGNVTEIGSLELKIVGGIKAGATIFVFPKENMSDFDGFKDKHKLTNNPDLSFYPVSTINEVFDIVFE